ncbi:MAG: DUF3800 domain-containing protein [Alphaproteobacteria bacterium]|nr:DUF3800 domain-containing protein [Alphaproteobacteria bacterium]
MQILFVDDSGDTSIKENGDGQYFVLGGVIVPEYQWHRVRDEVAAIKKSKNIEGEIKWRYFSPENRDPENPMKDLPPEERNEIRTKIFSIIKSTKSLRIISYVCSIGELKKKNPELEFDDVYRETYKPITERFQYFLQDMTREIGRKENGIIVCDHRGPTDDRRLRELHASLLGSNASCVSRYDNLIEGLFIAPSHHGVGIQLADMVAGAVMRNFRSKDDRWMNDLLPSFRKSASGQIEGYGLVYVPKIQSKK